MWAVAVCVLSGILLLGTGYMLLRGKWSFLIAGYNTASREEKKKYDERKLCRSAGMIVILTAVMMFAMAVCGWLVETGRLAEEKLLIPAVIFCMIIVASVAASMFYREKYCKI